MFKFPKGSKKQSDTANATDFLHKNNEENDDSSHEQEIQTALSIPDGWNLSDEERYVYSFHNMQSPPLKPGQAAIYGMELMQQERGVEVTALFRSSIHKRVHFADTTILLIDERDQVIARKKFNLNKLGTLPPNSSRPWTLRFGNSDFLEKEAYSPKEWSLRFEIGKPHELELDRTWENSISDKTKATLEKIVHNAPTMKSGEVNFMGIQTNEQENGNLATTVLIRNGTGKNIQLKQVQLALHDASDEEVVRGGFVLKDFHINANTSKPWTFVFRQEKFQKDNPDLSRWKVVAIE